MIWASIIDGKAYEVDRWKRPRLSSQEAAKDIRYLMSQASISSPEQIEEVVNSA